MDWCCTGRCAANSHRKSDSGKLLLCLLVVQWKNELWHLDFEHRNSIMWTEKQYCCCKSTVCGGIERRVHNIACFRYTLGLQICVHHRTEYDNIKCHFDTVNLFQLNCPSTHSNWISIIQNAMLASYVTKCIMCCFTYQHYETPDTSTKLCHKTLLCLLIMLNKLNYEKMWDSTVSQKGSALATVTLKFIWTLLQMQVGEQVSNQETLRLSLCSHYEEKVFDISVQTCEWMAETSRWTEIYMTSVAFFRLLPWRSLFIFSDIFPNWLHLLFL